MREFELIARYFAPLATHLAAKGLKDDAAFLTPPPGRELVLTKDMIAEGVHFLPTDPPATIGAKLLRVNLSDLAAKGAVPLGCLLGLGLTTAIDDNWIAAFACGLGEAIATFNCPLLGGDTISGLDRITLSLTAIGHVAPGTALLRDGAHCGDFLMVSGDIGGAALGLAQLRSADGLKDPAAVLRYQLPEPRLALGQAMTGIAHAACDCSDGLLADAHHLAKASGLQVIIEADAVPLAPGIEDRLSALTAGDDYELILAIPPARVSEALTLSERLGVRLTRIGRFGQGQGLVLTTAEGTVVTPANLGYQHG